jgi:hypothetical protein
MKGKILLAAAIAAMLTGCVTINIYFPAAAAEKAADKIIDKVLSSDKAPGNAAPAGTATQPKK